MKFFAALFVALFFFAAKAETLTFVTLTGAGSLSDTAIRQAAPAIEKHTGKAVVVLNMPGANGLLGVRHFLSQPADGKTLLVGNSVIGYLLETKQIDVEPVPLAGLAQTEMAVYTHTGIQSLTALLAQPDLKAGSTSPMTELSIRLFDGTHKAKTTVVGYKQFAQAITDLAAGRIEYLIAPAGVSAIEGMVAAGKIHKVASLGSQFTWNAIFAPRGVNTGALGHQIMQAVKETAFNGVQPFVAGPGGVAQTQQAEAALMRSAMKNRQEAL